MSLGSRRERKLATTTCISVAMLGIPIWWRWGILPLHISARNWLRIQANPEYLAVNWEASGGGAFAVIPINEKGRLPEQIPLYRGHTAPVLDTDWYDMEAPGSIIMLIAGQEPFQRSCYSIWLRRWQGLYMAGASRLYTLPWFWRSRRRCASQ